MLNSDVCRRKGVQQKTFYSHRRICFRVRRYECFTVLCRAGIWKMNHVSPYRPIQHAMSVQQPAHNKEKHPRQQHPFQFGSMFPSNLQSTGRFVRHVLSTNQTFSNFDEKCCCHTNKKVEEKEILLRAICICRGYCSSS